jgi:hypothetical protein
VREASNRLSAQPIIHHKSCQICSCYPCLLPVFTDKYGAGRLFRVLHTLDHRCLQSSMSSSNLAHFFALTTNLAITRQHSVWSTAAFRCTSTALHTAHCRVQMYFQCTAHGPLPRSNVLTPYRVRSTAACQCTNFSRPITDAQAAPFTIPAQAGSHSAANTASSGQGEAAGKVVTSNPVSSAAAWRASW